MLSGMLLHVIGPPRGIDAAMNWSYIDRASQNVNDHSRRLIFHTIDQCDIIQRTQIVWLAAGGRIKSGFIEYHLEAAVRAARLNDIRIEFQEVRIIVIEPLGLHL